MSGRCVKTNSNKPDRSCERTQLGAIKDHQHRAAQHSTSTHLHDARWQAARAARPSRHCLQQLRHVVSLALSWLHHHAHEFSLVGLNLLQQSGVLAPQLLHTCADTRRTDTCKTDTRRTGGAAAGALRSCDQSAKTHRCRATLQNKPNMTGAHQAVFQPVLPAHSIP